MENNNFLELYHGPTSAFKDAALLFLPQIMSLAKKKLNVNEEIVILAATSGDTGKAALEGFKDVDGFKVMVYYPNDRVSPVQEMQMVTQEGNNLRVVGINGNFDDAQSGAKKIFSDEEMKAVEEANILFRKNFAIPCTSCKYCVTECPKGIDIPSCFGAFNEYNKTREIEDLNKTYLLIPEEKRAHNCIDCKKCMEHCPQEINIPRKLNNIKELTK